MKSRFIALVALVALGIPALAQTPSSTTMEQRLRELEAKAARADALAERVKQLEGRLQSVESEENAAALEEAVNSILRQDAPVVAQARKASSLVIGGQIRLRLEYRDISSYGVADPRSTDEDLWVQRTRVNFDARIAPEIRAYVEIQDSRIWGDEGGVLADSGGVDLYQGYVDFEKLFDTKVTLRAGRFPLDLWNGRLVSSLDWHPVSRSWDGILLIAPYEEWTILGGFHQILEDPSINSDLDTELYWAAATYTGYEGHEFGGAYLFLDMDSFGTKARVHTLTLHAQGNEEAFDYSFDFVYQFGEMEEDLDISAFAIAAEVGYTFDCDWTPRVGLEWTYATGDDDPTDGDFESFNPLFPFGHKYQGYLDFFSWKNGHDLALHISAKPDEKWWVEIAVHSFWLDTTNDAWYNLAPAPIRLAPGADSDHVGVEVDISAKYKIAPNVGLWFGYSHFFTGDYVSETGADEDTDWIFIQLTANF